MSDLYPTVQLLLLVLFAVAFEVAVLLVIGLPLWAMRRLIVKVRRVRQERERVGGEN